jgi:flagellar protein FlaG
MAIDGIAFTDTQTLTVASRPAAPARRVEASLSGSNSAQADSTAPAPRPELPDLKQQLEVINRQLREQQSNLSFSIDESTGKTVVRVVRETTGEVVRQFPSNEVLAIAASLQRGESLTSLGVEEWS